MRHLVIAALSLFLCAPALAQRAALTDSAKEMVATGTWEFSNADRDKACKVTFKSDPVPVGFALSFDANCANLFPLVHGVVGWKYPEDDLLYLLDAQGEALIEFSEVEDGIFEAPTPGLGVVFLQNPAAAGPAPVKKVSDIAGDWLIKRGDTTVCAITLTGGDKGDTFPLIVRAGCDPAIANLKFSQWRLDKGEIDLLPANGEPWRFEETEGVWQRLSETEQIMLERQ